MSVPITIVALAARTPVGLTAETTAAAVRAGIRRIAEHPFLLDVEGEPLRCGYDATLGPAAALPERLGVFARHALHELTDKLANAGRGQVFPLLLALPEDRPGFSASAADELVRKLAADSLPHGCRVTTKVVGRGHAGGLLALAQAVERITKGQDDVCFVGGVDSYFDLETLEWLDEDYRLARPSRRGGFYPGEGAALIALASDRYRAQANLPALATIRAVACATETRSETAPEGLMGEALTDAYQRVGAHLAQPSEQFDDFFCDINAERPRTTDIGFALLRTGKLFRSTSYVTVAGNLGDIGAATAPLNCILATQAWCRGYASGKTALVSGASWTGLRGAALLERWG
jgi:3-oxoacyl-[acyl-carrier-protein] synthase-1